LKVSRFQVMAVLQAARAYALGLPLDSAQSWGLNRAIFIAAAKRGFKAGAGTGRKGSGVRGTAKGEQTFSLGDDMAYKTARKGALLFTIGGEVQTTEAFERQVVSRFGGTFPDVWKEALGYVKGFDKDVLLSSNDFFNTVYKPVRDQLAARWTQASGLNDK